MIAVDYDDTKILNILFHFFNFWIILFKLQLETRYSDSLKIIWSRCSVEYDSTKKSKTTNDGFWAPVSHLDNRANRFQRWIS